MKLIGKLIGTVFALVVTIFMVQGIASETGEVVVLTTVEQASGCLLYTSPSPRDH